MKRILSLVLTIVMVISVFTSMPLISLASSSEILDIDIYKAQCLLGIANDTKTDAVSLCHDIYLTYNGEDVFSASEAILDGVKDDKSLMKKLDSWKAYSLAAEPSTAMNTVLQRKDYYESLLLAIMSQSLCENDNLESKLSLEAANTSYDILSELCSVAGVSSVDDLKIKYPDLSDFETKQAFELAVSRVKGAGIASAISGNMSLFLDFSTTVIDAVERMSVYGTMYQLDLASKQWLETMYSYCDESTDDALKQAINNLKISSGSFSDSVLIEMQDASFRLANWAVNTSIDSAIDVLASSNPILLSVRAGFKLGKSFCDIFFRTSDVCEQLFLLECVSEVQDLSRKVMNIAGGTFLDSQSSTNATFFLNSVEYYFTSIIKVEYDCTKQFLDLLYNGGFFKGFVKWLCNASKDYDECVNQLNSLNKVRVDNYQKMMIYLPIIAVGYNYPETYNYYYADNSAEDVLNVEVNDINFSYKKIDLSLNDSFQNIAFTAPVNATIGIGIEYYSSNSNVATVDNNGLIKAVGEGTAYIIARSGNGIEDVCEITVYPFYFELNETGYTIDKYLGSSNSVSIPSTINGVRVTCMASSLFSDFYSITSIFIPETIQQIEEGTFEDCSTLESVYINNLSAWCNIEFAASTANPLYWATDFYLNEELVTALNIPADVSRISNYAFCYNTKLKTVKIPAGVTDIGASAFSNCINITSYDVDEGNKYYTSVDGVLFDKDKTILYEYPTGNTRKTYDMPDTVTYFGSSFAGCDNLTSVTISKNVTQIPNSAFFNCANLSSVKLPDHLTGIGDGAFRYCKNLTDIKLPSRLTEIGDYAFEKCKNLPTLIIPDSVGVIGDGAFVNCTKLKTITLPEIVSQIGAGVFAGCVSLESVDLPDNITSLGTLLLVDFNSEDFSLPYTGFFTDCQNLKNITIPESVTSIEMFCFSGCISLNSVEIPASVTEINNFSFDFMLLERIVVAEENLNFSSENGVLFNKDKTKLIRFPEGKKGSYKIPDSVKTIGAHAFFGCSEISSIEFPNALLKVDNSLGNNDVFYCGVTDIARHKSIFSVLNYSWNKLKNSCHDLRTVIYLDEFTVDEDYNAIFAYNFDDYDLEKKTFTISELKLENLNDYIMDIDLELDPSGIYYGTGSQIKSGDNIYTLIVQSDVNGDGMCDALDAAQVAIMANGHKNFDDVYKMAADGNSDDIIDADDYQDIVNKVVAEANPLHTYPDDWIVDVEATCTALGSKHKCCLECGHVLTKIIPIVEHIDSDEWTIDTEPTCTSTGQKSLYCVVCGTKTKTSSIAPIAHNYSDEWTIDIESTCTNVGQKSHHCIACGKKTNITSIAAIGHNYSNEWTIDVSPTCTQTGLRSKRCSACDDIVTESIESLGHDYSTEWTIDIAPTCTDNGSKSRHCSRCDSKTSVTAIYATGHTMVDNVCEACGSDTIWYYEKYDDYVEITGYLGTDINLNIPDSLEGLPVTVIGSGAFASNENIETLTISDNITTIGIGAFQGCQNLKTIKISSSVNEIGFGVFAYCLNLSSIQVDDVNAYFSSEDGILFNKDKTQLLCYPAGIKAKDYTVPDTVTTIAEGAFICNTYLETLVVPGKVKNINYYSFAECHNLKTVILENGIKNIGEGAFGGCINIVSITIPDSVTSIGEGAFSSCESLEYVTIPRSVTSIGSHAFSYCPNLMFITIPDSVISIGEDAIMSPTSINCYENSTAHTYAVDNGLDYSFINP